MTNEAIFKDREQYLYILGLMKLVGGSFYFDVHQIEGEEAPRRYMRVKSLSEDTARGLYNQIVGLLGSKQGVLLYAAQLPYCHRDEDGKLIHQCHKDSVRVKVPDHVVFKPQK